MTEIVEFKKEFVDRVNGDDFIPANLLDALNYDAAISVRQNPSKSNSNLSISKEVSWCENAVYLKERPVFTLDPLFHAGTYYSQEAGSMFLDAVLRQLELPENPKLLDLCGAPGGKSTLTLSFLDNKGVLVSNEVIQSRSRILKENITKWGYSNCVVTNNDPADFDRLPEFFDAIIVDAPCSGEGMFRKDPNARTEWSEDNVKLCSARQKRILSDIWKALSPEGYLIYSTCTFNEFENEQNVEWLISEFGGELISIQAPKSILKGRKGIGNYAFPGTSETEGFYIAVIKKSGERSETKMKSPKTKGISIVKDTSELEPLITLDEIKVFNWKDNLLAVPREMKNEFLMIYNELRIVKFGTDLGTIARKGLIPSHDLAMNFSLRKLNNCVDLDKNQALQYLKGETFSIENSKGFQIVCFEGEPLGWIKNLGNRFNNLYPKEWRIKMSIKKGL